MNSDQICLETKPGYKSKTNWFVNLPLFGMAILATFADALQDPELMTLSPIAPGKAKLIIWGIALLSFYLKNFAKQTKLDWGKTRNVAGQTVIVTSATPLTNAPADVILNSDDVQSPNQNYTISNEIPPEEGGSHGRY